MSNTALLSMTTMAVMTRMMLAIQALMSVTGGDSDEQ